jgi:hypothetical protein
MLKYLFLTTILYISIVVNVSAQNSTITASAPASVLIGQAFNYTISGDFSGKVDLPALKGFRLVGGPSTFVSQQSSIVNGKMENVKSVTYTYTLLAQEEGDFLIPPALITSGKKEIKTNEVKIKVTKSSVEAKSGSETETESVFIRQIPSEKVIYQGEQIVLSTKIYTLEALNISDFKAPGFDGFWRQDLEADQNANQENINGKLYLTQVFKRDLLTAQKTGSITIEAADLECLIRKRVSGNRQFFNDPFFDRYENVPQGFKTNTLNISVKPLPDDAPEGFSGAVGSFNLKVSIDKEKLNVNDAITLKVTISGNGNLDLLKPLKIDFPPDLEVFDPKSTQNIKYTENGSSGSLNYEYILIPRHAGNFRISPVVFSWFDPEIEKFKTLKSSEFTFTVDKSDSDDDAYITSPLSSGGLVNSGKDVVSLAKDIRFIRLTPPELKPIGYSIFGTPLFIAAFLIPVSLLILIVLLRKERIRRNSDMNAVRNRKARRLAEKRLKIASLKLKSDDNEFYDEILKAVWGYLSDKLGVAVSELSREKIEAELNQRNLDSSVLLSLWYLLDECEMARYASRAGGDKQKIYEEAIRLISILQDKIS